MSSNERPVYQFVFLRHGESLGNAQSRWQGQSDYPLTEKGRAQAQALAERWKAENAKFDLVLSSPLGRARETAAIIASKLDLKIEFDDIWLERAIGEMEGLTAEEVRQKPRPPYTTPYDSIGGDGEGDWALFLRAGQALHNLLKRPPGELPDRFARRIVEPGHACHRRRGSACDPSGVRFRFENTAFARVIYHPHQHRWAIDAVNDRAHLKSLETEVKMALSESAGPLNGKLKVLTFGAGAIGTYIGGSLALAGHPVVFVEQQKVVDDLRQRGMRLDLTLDESRKTKDVSFWTPLLCDRRLPGGGASLRTVRPGSVCPEIVRHPTALEGIQPFADKMPPILCLSNGSRTSRPSPKPSARTRSSTEP
jgi:broad specificity phosphatase PhoE